MNAALAWTVCAVVACALSMAPPASAAAEAASLEQQRNAFRAVYPDAERGNRAALARQAPLLRNYALWPDLEAAVLRAELRNADHNEVRAFLDRHGRLKPARELRYVFALHLAAENHWREYLDIYRAYYREMGVAALDCLALQAEIEQGNGQAVAARALTLWRIGKSQADECDAVFSYLDSAGELSATQYAERFDLAIESRQFSLARYLARSLDGDYLEQANRWIEAQNHAERFVATRANRRDTPVHRAQLLFALTRLGFSDPILAHDLWSRLKDNDGFDDAARHEIERHLALWAARRHLPEAAPLLESLPPAAADAEVWRWRARTALRNGAWDDVLRAIAAMPAGEQAAEEWRYWEAIALDRSGQPDPAKARLEALANTRSYYGFLAADALGRDYAFDDARLVTDSGVAMRLETMPRLVRARELFFVGIEGRGRSEWDAAIATLTRDEQVQAALLAHGWGWHSRAIATVSGIGEFDDLQLRYPLPWREEFARYTADANLNDSWAYGIARSESLFMRDIRSHAGAIGVMQLLPETGRRMAREIRHPYSGRATLTDHASNIRLGTRYLKSMAERFDDNRVLATAAYNAGPLRVEEWLPDNRQVDARIWIENIPFNETRRYVRRVLTADAIFHWRLTGETKRLTAALSAIAPAAGSLAGNHSSE